MERFIKVRRWLSGRERERVVALARYLWRRFLEDRCFETAGALSYTTVFAMVPLTAVALAVLSAFPVFGTWTSALTDFVFSNFVPESARAVEAYILGFAQGVGGLTLAGATVLFIAALLTLGGIESTFNRIWRVPQARPPVMRLLVYWSLLTLGTLLVAAALGFTSYFVATSFQGDGGAVGVGQRLLRLLPSVMTLGAFTLAFMVVPNRRVETKHALAGAALATVLFEFTKLGLTLYLRSVPTYQQLYGALAVIPIFLIWVYLSWVAILLGASLAASLSGFRFQPRAMRLPEGFELYGMLRLLGRFRQAQREGAALQVSELHDLEPILSDDQLQEMLRLLATRKVIRRDEDGSWMLSRDLNHLPLSELYDTGGVRIPVAEVPVPCRDDDLGQAALAGLDELRIPLRQALKMPVGRLIEKTGDA